MKINRKSWHYRIRKFWSFDDARNLCSYFWSTVWATALFPIVPVVALFVLLFLTAPLWGIWIDSQGFNIIIGIFEIFGLCVFWYEYRKEEYKHTVREPSLVKEFVKAKKQKICPLIEYE